MEGIDDEIIKDENCRVKIISREDGVSNRRRD